MSNTTVLFSIIAYKSLLEFTQSFVCTVKQGILLRLTNNSRRYNAAVLIQSTAGTTSQIIDFQYRYYVRQTCVLFLRTGHYLIKVHIVKVQIVKVSIVTIDCVGFSFLRKSTTLYCLKISHVSLKESLATFHHFAQFFRLILLCPVFSNFFTLVTSFSFSRFWSASVCSKISFSGVTSIGSVKLKFFTSAGCCSFFSVHLHCKVLSLASSQCL